MAKFTPFLGNISGKLKSVVFAYNKSGSYIRSWRASTKPFSSSQVNAQALFGQAVTSWHNLTDALKGAWNNYATTIFHAKHPVSGTAYSGYNSFVSLKTQADNLASKISNFSIDFPVSAAFTADFYTSVQTPPGQPFSSSIQDAFGNPLSLSLHAAQLSIQGGVFSADFILIGNGNAGIAGEGPAFKDAIGDEPCGLAIYGSKPGTQNNEFVQNPEFGLLYASPVIGAISDWTDSQTLSISGGVTGDFADRKVAYAPGQIVQAKAFLVGKNGCSQPLNAVKFEITV